MLYPVELRAPYKSTSYSANRNFSGRRSGPRQTESEVRADYIGVSRYLKRRIGVACSFLDAVLRRGDMLRIFSLEIDAKPIAKLFGVRQWPPDSRARRAQLILYACGSVRSKSNGRGDRIRTCDIYVPNVALYQSELHPEIGIDISACEPPRNSPNPAIRL